MLDCGWLVRAWRTSIKIPKLSDLLSHMLHRFETERKEIRKAHWVKLLRTLWIDAVLALGRLFRADTFLRNYIILLSRTVHRLGLFSLIICEILLRAGQLIQIRVFPQSLAYLLLSSVVAAKVAVLRTLFARIVSNQFQVVRESHIMTLCVTLR